jgi:hypothetical protein
MNRTPLGTYLDRPVILQELTDLNGLLPDSVSHAVVLLWLDRNWDSSQLEEAIKALGSSEVLNITITGWKADEAFSTMLTVLGPLQTKGHI